MFPSIAHIILMFIPIISLFHTAKHFEYNLNSLCNSVPDLLHDKMFHIRHAYFLS